MNELHQLTGDVPGVPLDFPGVPLDFPGVPLDRQRPHHLSDVTEERDDKVGDCQVPDEQIY